MTTPGSGPITPVGSGVAGLSESSLASPSPLTVCFSDVLVQASSTDCEVVPRAAGGSEGADQQPQTPSNAGHLFPLQDSYGQSLPTGKDEEEPDSKLEVPLPEASKSVPDSGGLACLSVFVAPVPTLPNATPAQAAEGSPRDELPKPPGAAQRPCPGKSTHLAGEQPAAPIPTPKLDLRASEMSGQSVQPPVFAQAGQRSVHVGSNLDRPRPRSLVPLTPQGGDANQNSVSTGSQTSDQQDLSAAPAQVGQRWISSPMPAASVPPKPAASPAPETETRSITEPASRGSIPFPDQELPLLSPRVQLNSQLPLDGGNTEITGMGVESEEVDKLQPNHRQADSVPARPLSTSSLRPQGGRSEVTHRASAGELVTLSDKAVPIGSSVQAVLSQDRPIDLQPESMSHTAPPAGEGKNLPTPELQGKSDYKQLVGNHLDSGSTGDGNEGLPNQKEKTAGELSPPQAQRGPETGHVSGSRQVMVARVETLAPESGMPAAPRESTMSLRTENGRVLPSGEKILPSVGEGTREVAKAGGSASAAVADLRSSRTSSPEPAPLTLQVAAIPSRMEWGHQEIATLATAKPEPSLPSETLRAMQETILHHSLDLKRVGAEALAITVRPDSATELFLHVRKQDGNVVVHVQCEQGNLQEMQSHWNQLSSSLADRGIRLAPLNEPPPASTPSSGGRGLPGDTPQNSGWFNQGRGFSRRQTEALEDLPMVGSVTEPLRRRGQRHGGGSKRGWESWA